MAFPAACSRRILNTVSNTNIPISPPDTCQANSLDHRDEGSFFDADHPATGVLFPRRSTNRTIRDATAGQPVYSVDEAAEVIWQAAHGRERDYIVGKAGRQVRFASKWMPERFRRRLKAAVMG